MAFEDYGDVMESALRANLFGGAIHETQAIDAQLSQAYAVAAMKKPPG